MGIPLRVLVLEDNPADAELVMHELRKAGYDPHGDVVETREDYLRSLGGELDLILADYNLPRFTAREALELLRAKALDIPFIVLTGVASEEAAVEAMKRGAADYLLKDRLARLGPAVQGALEQKSQSEAKRKADLAQQESDRLYRSLFENSPIGLCLSTPEGKIVRANEALLKWCGFSPSEAGRFSTLTQALDDDEDLNSLKTEIQARGVIPQRSTRLRNRDGDSFEALVTATSVVIEGKPFILWMFEDVAEWIRAERALQESQAELTGVFDAALDGIVTLDAEMRIMFFNPAAEAMFGQPAREVIGKSFGMLFEAETPWTSDRVLTADGSVAGGPARITPTGGEVQGKRASGEEFPVEITLSPFRIRKEQRHVAIVRDVTERRAAERALRESEVRYRTIFEGIHDAIIEESLEGEIVDANARACEMYGWPREELLKKRIRDLVPPGARLLTPKELSRSSDSILLESWNVRANGERFPVQISGRLETIGGKRRMLVVVQDTSELKEAEHELRDRAAHLEALNAIILASSQADELLEMLASTLVNTLKAMGLPKGCAWVGSAWQSIGLPEGFGAEPLLELQVAMLQQEGVTCVPDWHALPVDHSLAHLSLLAEQAGMRATLGSPILLDGAALGGLAVGTTDKRRWSHEEITLVESVARQIGSSAHRLDLLRRTRDQAVQLQQVLDAAPEGLIVLAPGGKVVMANPRGREYLEAIAVHDDAGSLSTLGGIPLSDLLMNGLPGGFGEIKTSEEPPRFFDALARPISLHPDRAGWIMSLREVTEARRLLQEAEQQRSLAAIGQLAAGIAHDFNNIIGATVLHTEILRNEPDLGAKVHARLNTIIDQLQRASSLIQQILDFSRRTIMEKGPVDLVEFLDKMTALLRRTLPETIRMTYQHEAASHVVLGDATRLQQVIMNLALNARDAMPSGGTLHFELSALHLQPSAPRPDREMKDGDWVALTITDTGMGIPRGQLEHIFEPFFTTKGSKGTGLGLAQVFGIVKQHDGLISVSTDVGQGTTFTIYLPAHSADLEVGPQDVMRPLPQGSGETILVVEDNESMLEAICEMLSMLRYSPLGAANGLRAIELLASQRDSIALILSDVIMPEMGGMSLRERVLREYPGLEVILMTGYPLGEEAGAILTDESVVWLQKPMSLSVLAEQVALGIHRASHKQAKT